MATSQMSDVIHYLRRAVLLRDGAGLTDGQLLECYLSRGEDAALEALVRRHGPMVWGVCHRVLGNHHDAEDAFQATFLVLVRKASTIMPREKVANWLYGVAHQTARKARATAARRKGRERQVTPMPDAEAVQPDLWHDLEPLLDQELSRLPDKYRVVLVLCDLEGRTRKEAARRLGIPEGTVAGHLARAREMLAKRLARHGPALSGAVLATMLVQNAASASVPTSLLFSTVKAVTLVATGQAVAGSVPATVAALVEGVMRAMLLQKLKIGVVALLMAFATAGVGGLTYRGLASGVQQDAVKQEAAQGGKAKAATGNPNADNQPATAAPLGAGPPRVQVEHNSPVLSLAWSPNGQWIATGTKDGTIHITDAASGKEIRRFATGNAVAAMAISPDGKTLATCHDGQSVGKWDTGTGKKQDTGGGGGGGTNRAAEHVAFTPDGQTIIGVGVGAIYLWQANGGGAMGFGGNLAGFAAIAPDGSVGGWCEAQGLCRFCKFDPNNQKMIGPKTMTTLQVGNAHSIAFGPGGNVLAVGGDDKQVQLWDLADKKATTKLSGLDSPASKLAFSADGKTLAALAGDGTSIRIYDLTRNTTRCQINHNRGEVGSLALSPDGKMLATTAKDGKVLFLWTTAARELSHKGPPLTLSAKELTTLWTDLANPDYEKADNAWRRLGAAGDNAIPMLREQIRAIAVPPVDMKRIEKLVAELDSAKFATRDQAIKELMAVGELAIVPLQRLMEKPPSAEARERANLILKKLGEPVLTPERQRVLDAIDLLEQVRTAAAIGLLEEIERDALIPQIRIEARQVLQRSAK